MNRTQIRTIADKDATPVPPPADARAAARDAGADMLGTGNLDQVREILFGPQSRGTEKRLARLEEDLPKRLAEIRDELKRALGNLEAYARAEIDSINERLQAEAAERDSGDQAAATRLDEAARGLRKEVAQLGERSAAAQREMRQQLLDQAKRVDEEIQHRSDDLVAALGRAVEELRTEKADRKAVAGILHEVAMRLADEFVLPSGDGAKS